MYCKIVRREIIGNRTRAFAYTFRVTAEEKKLIDEKIKASGLTMTAFIIRAITDQPVVSIPDVGEILTELKRQGNNLNQLARANNFGSLAEAELLAVLADIKKIYAHVLNVTRGERCRWSNAHPAGRVLKR